MGFVAMGGEVVRGQWVWLGSEVCVSVCVCVCVCVCVLAGNFTKNSGILHHVRTSYEVDSFGNKRRLFCVDLQEIKFTRGGSGTVWRSVITRQTVGTLHQR